MLSDPVSDERIIEELREVARIPPSDWIEGVALGALAKIERLMKENARIADELKKADDLLRYFEEQAIQAFNTRPSTLSSRF